MRNSPPAVSESSNILFSQTSYFSSSYQIYPGPLSSQARQAMEGFNLTSTPLQIGAANVTVTLIGTAHHFSKIIPKNYKLYIIELNPGDEGTEQVSVMQDDGFVVVDSNGYVV
jgi:hypothetical protein